MVYDDNQAYLQVGNSGTLHQLYDATALPANQWVFLAATYDPSTGTAVFYHNGVQASTATGWGSSAIGASSEPVEIGTWPGNSTSAYSFPGLIDDVRIYNAVLSAADIADIYNPGAGYVTGAGNEQNASPDYTYTYDADGNMITSTQTSTGNVWTYTYNFRNLMTGAVERNSDDTIIAQVTYTYDALDNRIGMDENGTQTWTLYDGSDRSWTSTPAAPWKCGI